MKKYLLFILCLLFCLISCKKNDNEEISFLELESMHYNDTWAVVQAPYIAFKQEPNNHSKIISHGRKGDILLTNGKKIIQDSNNNKIIWYKFEQGWIEGSALIICENKYQANTTVIQILGTK